MIEITYNHYNWLRIIQLLSFYTRVNKENKEKFGDIVEEILKDPTTEPYPDFSMRGIKGHDYYTENYGESGFFVGIHTEGEFAGQIKKAQPFSAYYCTRNSIINKILAHVSIVKMKNYFYLDTQSQYSSNKPIC